MSKRPPHPRETSGAQPGRGSRRAPSSLQDQVRAKMKAYSGTTTYIDLIRKNKRDSALLMAAMILLGVAIGALIGGVLGGSTGAGAGSDPGTFAFYVPSIVLGACVAGVVAVFGAIWSYFQGANAILRMVHAREVTPELDRELFNVVDEVRIAAGIPMPKVYLIPESALNAFATGRDPRHGVVAITTGLRARLTRDELQGVIAHEVAHIRHYDIRFSLLMATMVGLIVMACDIFLRMALHSGRGSRRSSSDKGGGAAVLVLILLAVVLSIIAPLLARFIQMAYSRQREYLADAGAVELTRNPEGLAGALAKLAGDEEPLVETANRGTAHMFIVNPLARMRRSHQTINSMFSSHPPIPDRIARIMALAR